MGPKTLLCKSCAYFRSFANQTKYFNKKLFGKFKKVKNFHLHLPKTGQNMSRMEFHFL